MMADGKGPPPPSATCPHCLFTWQGSRGSLSADALTRQHQGLDVIRGSFSPKERDRLFQSTGMHPGDAKNRLLRHSQWIMTGKKPLGVMKWPSSSDKKKLSQSANDPLIQVFTVTWLVWTNDSDLLSSQYCLTRIARLLKDMPDERWPRLANATGKVSARVDSLAYLRGEGKWTAAMDRVLYDSRQRGLQCWLLACASARDDRKPASWLASQIKKKSGWLLCEAAEDYYFNVGNMNDLLDLERAHDFWLKLERKRKSSWETSTSALGHIESSMSILRLKLIATTPPEKMPDATLLRTREK